MAARISGFINKIIPTQRTVVQGLHVALTAAVVATALPSYRSTGSLAMRSVLLLMATSRCVIEYRSPNKLAAIQANAQASLKKAKVAALQSEPKVNLTTYILCAKFVITALGLAGAVTNQPMLIVLSLTAQVVYSLFLSISDPKWSSATLAHLARAASSSLAARAITIGSWPMMASAAGFTAISEAAVAHFTSEKALSHIGLHRGYIDVACQVIRCGTYFFIGCSEPVPANEFTTLPQTAV